MTSFLLRLKLASSSIPCYCSEIAIMAVLVDKGLAGGGAFQTTEPFFCLLFCTLYRPKFRSFSKWKKVALHIHTIQLQYCMQSPNL